MKAEYIIKGILKEKHLKMKDLAKMMNTSPQNLTQRIKRDSFKYEELEEIAELLEYEIKWVKK